MSPPRIRPHLIVTGTVLLIAGALAISRSASVNAHNASQNSVAQNAVNKVEQGEHIFRFDIFGDQAFWGDTLKLHQAIEGAGLGGVGPQSSLGLPPFGHGIASLGFWSLSTENIGTNT